MKAKGAGTARKLRRIDKTLLAAKEYRKSFRRLATSVVAAEHVAGMEARLAFDLAFLRKERDRLLNSLSEQAVDDPDAGQSLAARTSSDELG